MNAFWYIANDTQDEYEEYLHHGVEDEIHEMRQPGVNSGISWFGTPEIKLKTISWGIRGLHSKSTNISVAFDANASIDVAQKW